MDEVNFDRVDALKRHLITVHKVEPTKKSKKKPPPPGPAAPIDGLGSRSGNNNARCSICSRVFQQARHWYEHLDDCILSAILQDEPVNQINTSHLLSVADDPEVEETLRLHNLKAGYGVPRLTAHEAAGRSLENEEEEGDELKDNIHFPRKREGESQKRQTRKGGIIVPGGGASGGGKRQKIRRRNGDYPPNWGAPPEALNLRRRALYVHDGPVRVLRDDISLYNSMEVRVPLAGQPANTYITDLDVQILHTAEMIYHTHHAMTMTVTQSRNFTTMLS
jgi:hypothetical protein